MVAKPALHYYILTQEVNHRAEGRNGAKPAD